jgi:phosphatidylglycerol:prolipoprotein diacylglycerol transferase
MFWVLIAGVLGARALYLLQEYKHYAAHPSEIFTLQFAGLTSFGGIIFGFAMVFLWCRRHGMPVLKVLDVAGPALLLGHAIGRIGCLLNGCCAGGACPADLPWGVHIDGVFVHPAQAYDSLMTFAALGIALFIEKRGTFTGQMISVTFMLYGLSRFIYEFWRAGVSSTYMGNLPITDAQAAALFMILLGAVMYSVYWRKARVQPTDEPPIKVVAA